MSEDYFETLPNEEQMDDDEEWFSVNQIQHFDVIATPEKIRFQII